MKEEQLICISTPQGRFYYQATSVAKEFVDKDQNIINTIGTIPDGEIHEFKTANKTVKHYKNGKLDGRLETIDLTTGETTFSEQYKNGVLIDLADHTLHGTPISVLSSAAPKYQGTLLKTNKNTLSFYVDGKEVAEQTLSSTGSVLEQLGEIPDGIVKELDENGNVRLEATYQNNRLEGTLYRYNERGDITAQETYKEGKLHGPAQYYSYYTAGKFTVSANYAQAVLEGKWSACTPDGQPYLLAFYHHGKLEGERTAFYKNGTIQVQEIFISGKLNGQRFVYYPQGELWYQEHYQNGRLDGERFCFFPNGQKYLEEFYTDGLLEGPRKIYTENGSVLLNEEYHWGNLISNTERKHK